MLVEVILEEGLIAGMSVVGEDFKYNRLYVPQVLVAARAMKAGMAVLKPLLTAKDSVVERTGVVVMGTVRGDLHDIGKNLVDIILTNNGYKVFNIGIKQPVDSIVKAAIENQADAIGLSGLLVKSTLIMKEDLEEMQRRGVKIPVICGGADRA